MQKRQKKADPVYDFRPTDDVGEGYDGPALPPSAPAEEEKEKEEKLNPEHVRNCESRPPAHLILISTDALALEKGEKESSHRQQ